MERRGELGFGTIVRLNDNVQVPSATCQSRKPSPSRAGVRSHSFLIGLAALLFTSTAFTSSLHGTRFSPSKAEEEIKKWVETSHPSSVLEGEAIGRKATN